MELLEGKGKREKQQTTEEGGGTCPMSSKRRKIIPHTFKGRREQGGEGLNCYSELKT